jgi:hypothetical protein
MDNEKGDKDFVEKTIEAVKDFVTSVEDITKHAMEPEPVKPGDEVVMLANEGGMLGEPVMPQFAVFPRRKSRAKKASKKTAKKAAKTVTKKAAKKSAKKTVKKTKTKAPSRIVKKKKKAKRGR